MAKDSGKSMQYVIGEETFDCKNKASAKLVSLYEKEISNLQSMQFAVGKDCFRCPMTAKGKAKSAGSKIAYRVGGFDFAEKNKAEKALKLIAEAVADIMPILREPNSVPIVARGRDDRRVTGECL